MTGFVNVSKPLNFVIATFTHDRNNFVPYDHALKLRVNEKIKAF